MNPADEHIFRELSKELNQCYDLAKQELGKEFDTMMAEIAVEITDLQYKCKDGTSHVAAGLMLCMPDEDDLKEDKQDVEHRNKLVKAAIVWMILNKPQV